MKWLLAAALCAPSLAFADGLSIESPMVPLAPPNAKAHAAFMTLSNPTEATQQIIGVNAEGYMMAHIHMSDIKNDVATMTSVDVIEVGVGQSVTLEHGGLHIMLMHPMAPKSEGDTVAITLEFADGTTQAFEATVMKMAHGM